MRTYGKDLKGKDLRILYDMEEMDFKNLHIPEEVAPYAKTIYEDLRE